MFNRPEGDNSMMQSGSSVSPLCSLVNAKARPSSGYSRMTLVGLQYMYADGRSQNSLGGGGHAENRSSPVGQ